MCVCIRIYIYLIKQVDLVTKSRIEYAGFKKKLIYLYMCILKLESTYLYKD